MKVITVKPEMLKGEIEITEKSMEAGAFFVAGGLIGNDIKCICKDFDFCEKYRLLFNVAEQLGGSVEIFDNGFKVKRGSIMKGGEIDGSEAEEWIPLIALMSAFCKGESRIKGVPLSCRKAMSEIASEFSHLGIKTEVTADGLVINGCQLLKCDGTYVWKNPYLAMTLVMGASRCEGELRVMGTDELKDEKFSDFLEIYNKIAKDKIK